MTKKPGPDAPGLSVKANAEPKGKSAAPRSAERRFVAVENVLFAGMGKRVMARVFTDAEINRLAAIFGLSPGEVAELYGPADLKPAAGARRRRQAR
jgi:hypothetical protein